MKVRDDKEWIDKTTENEKYLVKDGIATFIAMPDGNLGTWKKDQGGIGRGVIGNACRYEGNKTIYTNGTVWGTDAKWWKP